MGIDSLVPTSLAGGFLEPYVRNCLIVFVGSNLLGSVSDSSLEYLPASILSYCVSNSSNLESIVVVDSLSIDSSATLDFLLASSSSSCTTSILWFSLMYQAWAMGRGF